MDLTYIAQKIADMAGVPIRIFRGTKKICFFSVLPFPADPFDAIKESIPPEKSSISYFVNDDSDYYGFLTAGKDILILGPGRSADMAPQVIRRYADRLNLTDPEQREVFSRSMGSVIHLPLDTLLQTLSMVHYAVNGEKIELEDIKIRQSEQEGISRNIYQEQILAETEEDAGISGLDRYKAFEVEETICDFIRHGDPEGFQKWCEAAPTLRSGVLSPDYLRNLKNTFIVSATLFSRAAIKGGMDFEDALDSCDNYIRQCDAASFPASVTALQYHMALYYASAVEETRSQNMKSDLMRKVNSYIRHNLSKSIRIEEMAQALYLSRGYLSTKFKKDTGITLNRYIHIVKISEARHLLKHSDQSILEISNYLGYSSPGYFSNVFKKYTGMTPGEYAGS